MLSSSSCCATQTQTKFSKWLQNANDAADAADAADAVDAVDAADAADAAHAACTHKVANKQLRKYFVLQNSWL